MTPEDLVAALRPHLSTALVATDFDGTLAPLQVEPDRSRLVDGALEALAALAERGARIAVVTGRDARTVLRLGTGLETVPGLEVVGIYGIETWRDGDLATPDTPPRMTAARERLPDVLRVGDPAIWIEDKRLSLVVHARRTDDPAQALTGVEPAVRDLAQEIGLEVHPGSGVLELRMPGFDKAGALDRLAEGRDPVLFLGDDVGDIPAFEHIAAMKAQGRAAWGVGVLSTVVGEIRDVADVTVADPPAVVDLLRALTA